MKYQIARERQNTDGNLPPKAHTDSVDYDPSFLNES